MADYEFKGYDWEELPECWGITVEEGSREITFIDIGNGLSKIDYTLPERIDKVIWVGDQKVTVSTEDHEVIILDKTINHMRDNLSHSGDFIDEQMRTDIHGFLKALIEQSKGHDYNYPVYEGILKLESDFALVSWMAIALPTMWT